MVIAELIDFIKQLNITVFMYCDHHDTSALTAEIQIYFKIYGIISIFLILWEIYIDNT